MTTPAVDVSETDRLWVPHRKRMTHAYVTADSGARELVLYYGVKEVSFDEEHLFAFGERLVRETSFLAGEATAWGPGYAWGELRPLFEALVAEGVLRLGEASEDPRAGGLAPSPLPPASCPAPRAWTAHDTEAITRELGGRAVEIGYLEAILSVYRIAHPALDGDDRQVGEANVFPPQLRLERDTEWRVCQYAGSRYRDEAPMNVTALRAMIKHWKPMMATLLEVRGEVARRLARVRPRDGWTVGELHLLSSVVLALPAFQLMTESAATRPRPLHPVLSSLFRITDGVRMTTHAMMFLSEERTRHPDEPTTASELYAYAERNGLFLAGFGVCAGPRPMIDEFLATIVDGTPVEGPASRELAPEVAALLARLPEAIEYGLLGVQAWAISRSAWLAMSRAYRAVRALLDAACDPAVEPLRARLGADWELLGLARITVEYEHDVHVTVYRDGYEQAWQLLRAPVGAPRYADQLAPCAETAAHRAVAEELRAAIARSADGALAGIAAAIAAIVVEYARAEQTLLRTLTVLQGAIDDLVGRPHPARPLTVRDLRAHYAYHPRPLGDFPYLLDTLGDELGFHLTCTAGALELAPSPARRVAEPSRHADCVVGGP